MAVRTSFRTFFPSSFFSFLSVFPPLSSPTLSPDVSSFQMNDSSYDSLENELNDDPESPCQDQLPLRDKDKPDSRSRDSVITLSDCDPDPDPEAELLLQLPQLARPRRFSPAARQPRPRQANGQSQGPRRLRRSSEPALTLESTTPSCTVAALVNTQRQPVRKASYDAAMEGQGDGVFLEQRLSGLQLKEEEEESSKKGGAKVQNGGRRKEKHIPPPPLRLDASCSSLSSPATSPTGSSLSSLDSAFSQYSTDYTTSGAIPPAEPAPISPGRAETPPKGSPPQREAWTPPTQPSHAPANSHGLHPNTWLRKDRRLSLRQAEEDVPVMNGKPHQSSDGSSAIQEAGNRTCQRRSSSPPSYQQALLQLQRNRSPFYRASEKPLTVKEVRQLHHQTPSCSPKPQTGRELTQRLATNDNVQPPQGVFYGQSATTLVLQRQKSHPLTANTEGREAAGTLNLPRRASEPPAVNFNLTSSLTHSRPRASKGELRGSEVQSDHGETRFRLSPSATRAVRDYFSTQGREDADGCLRRSQEVALAIVQGKREWQSRRCSDPRVDEFEKLFFAEESYV